MSTNVERREREREREKKNKKANDEQAKFNVKHESV